MKIVAIIQARMGATRLPKKTLVDLAGKPMLWHIVERLKRCKNVDETVVATSILTSNDLIKAFCDKNRIACFRGSEEDVLSRYYECAKKHHADHIVRITADNPLIDPANIDAMVSFHMKNKADLTYTEGMPLGTGPGNEVISFYALERSHIEAKAPEFREHPDEYIIHNLQLFKIMSIDCTLKKKHPEYRLTVDTEADFKLISNIYEKLYKEESIVDLNEVLDLMEKKPELVRMNSEVEQKKVLVK